MAENATIRVSQFLDECGFTGFQARILLWSLFIVLIDGYDLSAIAFAAPHLVHAWAVSPAALGPVFSASLVGVLFGSAVFGWVGDRFGRRAALIWALIWFGVWTLAAAAAASLTQMFWLRLLAGIGIGSIIPNIVALNAECAPTRLRGTLAIIAAGLVPLGGAIPGVISATLVARYGWQILFLIGGGAPIVIALAAMLGLPESIKFLALHARLRGQMEAALRRLRPGFVVPAGARFVIEDEATQFAGHNPLNLFRDGLALITPLLWLLFALNLMGYFFIASWTPTVLIAAKLPLTTAALAAAALQVGGTVGALLLCRWISRKGFLAITILFIAAVPVVGAIGYVGVVSQSALMVMSFLAGFCVLGIQSGINGIGALVYPTSLRANGSGWELGIGRLGSVVGPLVGVLLVGLPVQSLYVWAALPFVLGAAVCFAIYRLITARSARAQTALAMPGDLVA